MSPAQDKINEWNAGLQDKDLLFIKKLKASDFGIEQIATILKTIDGVCHKCWDDDYKCQCWNDE